MWLEKEMMELMSWAEATVLRGLVGLAVARRMKQRITNRRVTSGGVRGFFKRMMSRSLEGQSCRGISRHDLVSLMVLQIQGQDKTWV